MQTYLVGGPLNGKQYELDSVTPTLRVPVKKDPNAWTPDYVALYALGDKGATGFRYHVGNEDLQGWTIAEAEPTDDYSIVNVVCQ